GLGLLRRFRPPRRPFDKRSGGGLIMNAISARQLLIVIPATAIALYLLDRLKQPSPRQHTDRTRHRACAQVSARNHSGVAPYDPFGFCGSERGRDDFAGRDLPREGRRP